MERKRYDWEPRAREIIGSFIDKTIGPTFDQLDIHPNVITTSGVGLGLLAADRIQHGDFRAARPLTVLSLIADYMDGLAAKRNGKSSELGAFLDSVGDRAEFLLYQAWGRYAQEQGWRAASYMSDLAQTLSLLPSTMRCEAEKYDIAIPKLDFGSRVPRALAATACVMVPKEPVVTTALGYVAVSSGLTTASRMHALLSQSNPDRDEIAGNLARIMSEWTRTRNLDGAIGQSIANLGIVCEYARNKAMLITQYEPDDHILHVPLTVLSRSVGSLASDNPRLRELTLYLQGADHLMTIAHAGYNVYRNENGFRNE